jgi:hypothetical protein
LLVAFDLAEKLREAWLQNLAVLRNATHLHLARFQYK